jgi:hypothetical protein
MNRGIADTRFTLGEIVASGWDLYCLHFKRILPIFLVVYVPINIGLSFIPVADWAATYGDLGRRMYMGIIQLTEFFLGTLATMALAKLMEESLYGHSITWLQALRHAVSRWGAIILTNVLAMLIVFGSTLLLIVPAVIWAIYHSFILTNLLAMLIVFGLTLLLIIPAVIWAIYYSLFLFVVALRGLSGKQALDYSKAMVEGQWWRVFGYLLAIQLLALPAAIVVTAPLGLLPEHRLLDILSNTLSDIVAPLFLTMVIVFFLNNDYLRTWREPASPPAGDATSIPPSPDS